MACKACESLPARSPLHQVVFSGTVSHLWFDMVKVLPKYACAKLRSVDISRIGALSHVCQANVHYVQHIFIRFFLFLLRNTCLKNDVLVVL